MKSFKSIIICAFTAIIAISNANAQGKKLVDDIYTYNYAKIIKDNRNMVISVKSTYPNQRALAFSYAQSDYNEKAFDSYTELFNKFVAEIDDFDRLCFALVARKLENYSFSDSLLLLLKSTSYKAQPFFNELSQEFIDQNKGSETYWLENDFSVFYAVKPFPNNTKNGEYALVPDKKGNAYYSSFVGDELYKSVASWHDQPYYKIFKSVYGDSTLGKTVELSNNKSNSHQHVSYYDVNTGLMYITRNAKKKNANREKVLQIFALRQNLVTQKWIEIPFPLNNDKFSVADLVISPDGKKVIFASDMPGGYGKSDLYEAPILESDAKGIKIGEPKNMGPEINTTLRDNFPCFSDSGQFYFSSDGHLGFGGLDIFFVDANTNMVLNAGKPINSAMDDFAPQIHDRDAWGTLTSNRMSRGYDDNLYFFRWVGPSEEEIAKSSESSVIVEVVDEETNLPIKGADVVIVDLNNSEVAVKGKTDDNGVCSFNDFATADANPNIQVTSHPCGYRYALADSMIDLTNGSSKIILKAKAYKVGDDLGKLFDIQSIHYASAKFNITDDSKRELDKLVVIMQDNPGLGVELGSHTDSRASSEFNKTLSENRAKAAYEYAIGRGAEPSRLEYRGYGETKLINQCADGVNCSDFDHAQNRRTEFLIKVIIPCINGQLADSSSQKSQGGTSTDSLKLAAKKKSDLALADVSQGKMICGDGDADGIPDYLDTDSDNDGIPDATEGHGDTDKDGYPNSVDRDSDNDGIADGIEKTGDMDKDGKGNYVDTDSDGDGIDDKVEGTKDSDNDSQPDFLDIDSDSDGIPDSAEGSEDLDRDGLANYVDLDSDGDGIADSLEGRNDMDHDGKPNFLDLDSDGDTIPDVIEKGKTNTPADSDNDGKPDYQDLDSDEDGIFDKIEAPACLPGQKESSSANRTTPKITDVRTPDKTIKNNVSAPTTTLTPVTSVSKVQYRIQFTISKNPMPIKSFKENGLGAIFEYQQNGYYKYCTDKVFNSEAEAAVEKSRVRGLGYNDAFTAGFQNGVRVK